MGYHQIIYWVEARCWEFSWKVGWVTVSAQRGMEMKAYQTWGLQAMELAALCWRKHDLVESPEFPSCSSSFSRERKWRSFSLIQLPSCITLAWGEHATVMPFLEALACEVLQEARGDLAREKQPLCTWELCGSHAGDYTGILPHSWTCFICPSLHNSTLGLVSQFLFTYDETQQTG